MKSSTLRMIPPVPVALAVVSVVVWLVFPSPLVHGVVIGALVVTVALVGGVVFIGPRMRERLQSHLERPALPSKTWDYAMQAETLDGEVVEFTRFSGRVLVLNLWATWCTPCLAEMPSLARLQERGSDLEVELACLTQEGKEVVERFLARRELGVPIYVLRGQLPECFASRAIPATFIIDRTGFIALRHVGAAQWDDERVVAFVRGLAASPLGSTVVPGES